MRIGLIVPQGWTREYEGWDPVRAWGRTVDIARRAEACGFDGLFVFDHVHTTPEPAETITFEAFTTLALLASETTGVRLGQLVTCALYRNPALLAKMVSTLDVASGGRMELGLGAGWKEEEFHAYGWSFPPLRERHAALEDALRIVRAMFDAGRATVEGRTTSVDGAINEPKPLQGAALPLLVGGNGRDVTWRLAARWADELNLDAMPADELPEARRVIADRCAEIGRDPASLRVSVHLWWEHLPAAGDARVDVLGAYRAAGVDRVMTLLRSTVDDVDEVDRLAEDATAAGYAMSPA